MRSPFAIFRKHQKTAMVILIGLAMFAFVILDSVSQMQGPLPPAMVALMVAPLAAGAGWLLGVRGGNGKEFALVGAALGVAGALLLSQVTGPAPAVQTQVESISERELSEMINRRNAANQFLSAAFQRSVGNDQNFGMMFAYWRNQWLFGYGRDPQQDVALAHLYGYEAEELDIRVPDEAVSDYINQATQNKLSAKDFLEIRKSMGLSESALYDMIREQLRARRAVELLMPRTIPTPEEYWQLYRKLHVRQALDVAAVPVAPFESEVPDPSEADLRALFEQYKTVYPNARVVDPQPKFGQPRKVRVAYLEADYETFAQKVPEVTDAEIEAFYEENKELYRNNVMPEEPAESAAEGDTNPLDPEFTPETGDPEAPATPEESESETPSDDSADETPSDETSATDPADSEDGAITDSGLEDEEGAQPESDASPKSGPVEAPRPAAATPDSPGEDETTATDEASTEPLPEFQPLDEELREEIRDQLLNERAQEAMKAQADEAYAFMYSLSDKYYSVLPEPGEESEEAQAKKMALPPTEGYEEQLQKFADEHDMKFVDTGLVSADELMDPDAPDELSIGAATDPVESEIERADARDVISQLFGDRSEKLYIPHKAENFGASKRYAYWKSQDVPARVPSFDEPGVEEAVLAAWKRQAARPLAKKRADELAEVARAGTEGVAAALGGQTVTGAADGEPLTILETEQFSWLRQPSVPQLNPFAPPPPPERSQITGVEYPGEDFMNTIFNDLGEGDIGVVTNANQSIYYVVMAKNRSPSTEGGEEALRQGFLRENLFSNQFMMSPYAMVMSGEQREAHFNWVRSIEQRYGLQMNTQAPEAN